MRGDGRYRRGVLTSEFALIERLRKRLDVIGDDTAVLPPPPGPLLLTTDAVIEGVHADLRRISLEDFGWKAVAVNVSDIAAMGGRPVHVLGVVAAPEDTELDRLFAGMDEALDTYGGAVVGGDLSNAPCVMVTVAMTGTVDGEPVRRSGAKAGDGIFVTGPLGAAAASGYRTRPHARLAEGQAARQAGATAMIDVSDGLAADLGRLAHDSRVGVALDEVPVADGATLDQALGGGEDFELVFTASGDPGIGIRIGTCTDDPGQRTLGGEPLPATGWEHRFG